jgi:hypothetical protein
MHRECPREFQDRIDQEFGTNQYGEPLYKFAWGQTETMRGGGAWANGFVGYKDVLVGGNDPCWPMVRGWQALSKEAQVEALRYEQRLREEEIARAAIEAKQSYAPAFKGNAVSFTRQGCRTSLIAKKEEFLEKNWKRLMQAASLYQRGMNQV